MNTLAHQHVANFKVGDRVVTVIDKNEAMIGIHVPAGVHGTIVELEPYDHPSWHATILGVRLDQHFEDLDEWDNVLQFFVENEREKLTDYIIHE